MGRFTRAAVLGAGLLAASPAGAAWAAPGDDGTHRREGEYTGVDPDGQRPADAKPIKKPAAKTLGWVGFEATEGGGAEVFFQASQPFTVTQTVEGDSVVVFLDGLTKLARNVRRPLDARFFETPIARITTKAVRAQRARRGKPGHPAGVMVRIQFKRGAKVAAGAESTTSGPDGIVYRQLAFAPQPDASAPPSTTAPPGTGITPVGPQPDPSSGGGTIRITPSDE